MGNGLRSYVQSKLVDYATARWLLFGSVPAVVVGALVADRLPSTMLKAIFGGGLVVLGGFLVLVRSPEECEPGDRAVPLIDRRSIGRGTTVISARDGRVYEYPTCWRAPGVMLAAVGGLFTGLISAGLPEISTTQLVIRCRVPPRVAVATSVFTLAIVALAGATIHALAASPPPACRGLEHSRRARREYHRQPRGLVHSGSPHGEGARYTIRSGRCPRPGPRVRHVTRPARAPEVGHRQPEEGRADIERQIAQDVCGEPLGFFGSERIVLNCTLRRNPELSHTEGLIRISRGNR